MDAIILHKNINKMLKILHNFAKTLYPEKYITKRIDDENYLDEYIKTNLNNIMLDIREFYNKAIVDEKVTKLIDSNIIKEIRNTIETKINNSNYTELLNLFINNFNEIKLKKVKPSIKEFKEYLIYFHVIERINRSLAEYQTEEIFSIDEQIGQKNNLNNEVEYYRGQSNYNWTIVPSFCRELDSTGISIFNSSNLDKIYKKSKKTNKFKDIFNYEYNDNYYEFLAFMQHSISYSPLVDFTEVSQIALSFALHSNTLDYYKIDSSIFVLRVEKENIFTNKDIDKINNILKNYSFLNIGKNTRLYSIISNQIWSDYLSDISQIQMYVFDIKSNDRMKYQHGVFVLFDKFILIGNKLILTNYLKNRFVKKIIKVKGPRTKSWTIRMVT